MTSGRFTPAAATLTRISPSPGWGTGRCSATTTSGPPGALMPIAVMVAGIVVKDSMTTIPATMTAIGIKAPGGPEVVVAEQRPVPQPGEGEILVKVAAAGVNRPDVMQRKGLYPPPPGVTDIPGLEIAGAVAG